MAVMPPDQRNLDDDLDGRRHVAGQQAVCVVDEGEWEHGQRDPFADIERPAGEKSDERPERRARIGVRAADVGVDSRALDERQRDQRGEDARRQPGDELRRSEELRAHRGHDVHVGADHGADHEQREISAAEICPELAVFVRH